MKDDTESVDTLRYSWEKIVTQATQLSHHLLEIQPDFKGGLLENVETFITDCDTFYDDYKEVSISPTILYCTLSVISLLGFLVGTHCHPQQRNCYTWGSPSTKGFGAA